MYMSMYTNYYELHVKCFHCFRKEQTYDHLDLFKEFECIKRTLGTKDAYTMKIPASFNDICRKDHDETFAELTAASLQRDNISFIGDKIRMKKELVEKLFRCAKITYYEERIFK